MYEGYDRTKLEHTRADFRSSGRGAGLGDFCPCGPADYVASRRSLPPVGARELPKQFGRRIPVRAALSKVAGTFWVFPEKLLRDPDGSDRRDKKQSRRNACYHTLRPAGSEPSRCVRRAALTPIPGCGWIDHYVPRIGRNVQRFSTDARCRASFASRRTAEQSCCKSKCNLTGVSRARFEAPEPITRQDRTQPRSPVPHG